jgi:hypothetical protein
MSKASASREVKYLRKSGTYMVTIMSSMGDLWQEYSGENNANVRPDWSISENQPTLEFVCTSSRVSTGAVEIYSNQIHWYFNDEEINFNDSGASTGKFAGLFSKVTSNSRQGLKITGNIVSIAGYASATIKAIANIVVSNATEELQATYTIPIQESSGKTWKVTIAPGDSKNFVIDEKGGSCQLKALVYFDGALSSQTFTYKWYVMSDAKWSQITGATSQTITVSETDVNTYGDYMVEVYLNGDVIGTDAQGVMDVSDPYIINPGADPSDETISEESGSSVIYRSQLLSRESGAVVSPQPTFSFVARDPAGNILKTADEITIVQKTSSNEGTGFEVSEEVCAQSGGDVSVIITANDF